MLFALAAVFGPSIAASGKAKAAAIRSSAVM